MVGMTVMRCSAARAMILCSAARAMMCSQEMTSFLLSRLRSVLQTPAAALPALENLQILAAAFPALKNLGGRPLGAATICSSAARATVPPEQERSVVGE